MVASAERGGADVAALAAAQARIAQLEAQVGALQASLAERANAAQPFERFFERANDAMFIVSLAGRFLMVNAAACERLGYSRDELLRMGVQDIDTPEFAALASHRFAEGIPSGGMVLETAHVRRDGTVIPTELSVQALDYGGAPAMISIARDITQRKWAEQALQEKTAELDRFFSMALDLLVIADTDGYFHRLNPSWEHTLGYIPAELEGKRFLDLVHPEDMERTIAALGDLSAGKTVVGFVNRYHHKDGSWRSIEWRAAAYRGKLVYAAARDITERVKTENTLRRSEEQIRLLLECTAEAIYGIDMAGQCTFANPACVRILRYGSTSELLGKNMHAQIHHSYRDGTPFPVKECRIFRAFRKAEGAHVDDEVLWRADGTCFEAEYWSFPQRTGDAVVGAVVAFIDISERRTAEKALRTSQQSFQAVVVNSPIGLMVVAPDGTILYANPAVEHQLVRGTLTGSPLGYPVIVGQMVQMPITRENGEPGIGEMAVTETQWQGRSAYLVSVQDATERVRSEGALLRNYDLQSAVNALLRLSLEDVPLKQILDHALELVLSIPWLSFDSRGSIFTVEDEPEVLVMQAQKGLGAPTQEACARVPFGRCLCGRATATRQVCFAADLDERHEVSYEGMGAHGHYCVPILWGERVRGALNVYLRPGHVYDSKEVEFLETAANTLAGIIDRRRTIEALRTSEANLANAQRIAHMGSWALDVPAGTLQWSDEVYRIFGLAPRELASTYDVFLSRVHPNDRERVQTAVAAALRGDLSYSLEHRIQRPDGGVRIVQEQAEVTRDKENRPLRMLGTVMDITALKEAEIQQTRQRERLEALWRISRLVDADLQTISGSALREIVAMMQSPYAFYGFVEPGGTKMRVFSYSRDVMADCRTQEKPLEFDLQTAGVWAEAWRTGEIFVLNDYAAPHANKKGIPTGHVTLTRIMSVPVHVGNRLAALVVVANKSENYTADDAAHLEAFATNVQLVLEHHRSEEERQRMQEQLQKAQKMEAVGLLAGGVAHDFNNILTVIRGHAQMALMDANANDPAARDLQVIDDSAVRASNLTRQLLLFSRQQPMEFRALDLNQVIKELLKMLDRLIGEDITIVTELEPRLWTVMGDAGNIDQVIMNLAVNARDAMPDGGRLSIKTENIVLDEEFATRNLAARASDFVRLSISDTGVGMDKEVQAHLFEPFFTTKSPGKGTGLGLSVVYGIVHHHQGWITVYSEKGQGSSFVVCLPAVRTAADRETPAASLQDELHGHGERILVVEDDLDLRELVLDVLRHRGYKVTAVSSAEEALKVFDAGGGVFDAVLSDTVLPGMSGLQLAEELLVRKPGLRVLLSSGYTDDRSRWNLIREKRIPFLQKPYPVVALLRAVRDLLAVS